ncbi:calcium sensing receptor, chloroplastic [Physcomitrium patens]|uniref:Rhodanese domain-containing protein n=1 Tax=Physcomitrium patens TaxID=3218 RepID=A0A2K1JG14_PHYPA|nr:calcium sensing receptor, chloroplastic-like [Physcomitrium patens]XP_024395377.1 calcium sensing receptor, chloroplastic-like [Physcomitrium patens]PNR40467.1 hypothetical protein PHYPA_017869 [Physcomitrium patens]|eukprot:XP_024395376.1 calcium sensing receptor, chloroplastic-like [Physcomitrella patens]
MAQAMRTMQVTALNGALAGSSQSVDKSASLRISKRVPNSRRPALSLRASAKDEGDMLSAVAPSTIASIVVLADVGAASALTAEDVTQAYVKAQEAASQASRTAGDTFDVMKNVYEQIVYALKPAVSAVTPYAKQSADYVYKTVSPIASDLEKQAEKALQSTGVDTKPVVDAAKTAASAAGEVEKYIEGAQPSISSTLQNVLSSDPIVLAAGAGALLLVYLLTPPLLSSLSYAARGFKGEFTAFQALDLLSKEDYYLIDVRSEKEKAKSGVPSLPRNAKNKFLPVPVEELPGKVRGQLRNARNVEAEIAALKISSLKRLNKGSRLIIIDSNGDISKTIARCLSGLGFSNTWVITDGFDGGRGWVQSRLGTESSGSSFSEILSPSRIIPAGTTFLQAGRD